MEESNYYHINLKHILKNTQCSFFNKDVREFNGERTVFSLNGARTIRESQARIKLKLKFTAYTSID